MRRLFLAASLAPLVLSAATAGAQTAPRYPDVAAVFAARCIVCHSGESAPLGLRLDSYDGVLKGSQKGPVVKPGSPAESELVKRIRGRSVPRMPLTGPPFLSDEQIALIEQWIAAGAERGDAPTPAAASRPAPRPGEPVTYAHVAPILLQRCVKCHTDGGAMGPPPEGFRLRTYRDTLDAADRARIVPGNPAASELVRRIRGQSLPRMPFDGPPYLSEADIRLIEQWIAEGARDAEGRPAPVPVGARIRLHGTLTGSWGLDGLPLRVDGRTRIDKRPGSGDRVRVEGIVETDGAIHATRIRRR